MLPQNNPGSLKPDQRLHSLEIWSQAVRRGKNINLKNLCVFCFITGADFKDVHSQLLQLGWQPLLITL